MSEDSDSRAFRSSLGRSSEAEESAGGFASELPPQPDEVTIERWEPTVDGLAFLSQIHLLRRLVSEDFRRFANALQVRVCQEGEIIIYGDDQVREFYIVESGRVYACVKGDRAEDYGPGSIIGAEELIGGMLSSFDLIADETPTRLLFLSGDLFRRLAGPVYVSMRSSLSSLSSDDIDFAIRAALMQSEAPEEPEEFASDEEELEEEPEAEVPWRAGPRGAIYAEPSSIEKDWIPPVFEKTPAQRTLIRHGLRDALISELLPIHDLRHLVNAFKGPQHFRRGELVARQGQYLLSDDPALFIIQSGELEVFVAENGAPFPGNYVDTYDRPGRCFGELSVLHNAPRRASVVAATDSVLWSLDRCTFNQCAKRANAAMHARREEMLTAIPLFNCLEVHEIAMLADVLKSRAFQKGDIVARPGPSRELIIVEAGRVYSFGAGRRNEEYGPSESFGERCLLKSREKRQVAYYADETPTRVAILEADAFARIFGPLAKLMAKRSRQAGKSAASLLGNISDLGSPLSPFSPPWQSTQSAADPFGPGMMDPQSPGLSPTTPSVQAEMAGMASPGVGLGPFEGRQGVFLAWYPRRLPEVGGVQGPFPLAPGESFSVVVRSRGTFGEIAIGLAPLRAAGADGAAARTKLPALTDGVPKGKSMVGWGQGEVGYHGDHGKWYCSGKLKGTISPAWEVGDTLTCGLTQQGTAFFARAGFWLDRSGQRFYEERPLAEAEGFWAVAHAYPTVTFYSGGAELVVDLSGVDNKSSHETGAGSGHADQQPRTWDLLDMFKRTSIAEARRRDGAGVHFLERWLGFGVCTICSPANAPGGSSTIRA